MCEKSSTFVANFKRIEWRKVMKTPIEDIIRSFEPISLTQMESVKLMNRIDTKYAVPMAVLPAILEAAQADYYAQEIDGKRIATYDTMYYDTGRWICTSVTMTVNSCGRKSVYANTWTVT